MESVFFNVLSLLAQWGFCYWVLRGLGVEVPQRKGQQKRERTPIPVFSLKPSYLHPLFFILQDHRQVDIRSTSITSIHPLNTSTCHSAKKQQGAYTRVKWDRIYVQYNCQFSVSFLCLVSQPTVRKVYEVVKSWCTWTSIFSLIDLEPWKEEGHS